MEALHDKTNLHPFFHDKEVYEVKCKFCCRELTNRGMKAILLADTNVDLYSTDMPPKTAVELIGKYFTTKTCACKIKDFACLSCGNPVGYHVALPCAQCLESCNNGHFWIFHCHTTTVHKRLNSFDSGVLTWGDLSCVASTSNNLYDSNENLCR
uniref:Protein FAM72A-like n=1 Tax=Phallusia mammillata TaxID=59560 RepID=A0A6F9DBT5_9ASCI|nr:protein FAM72A-like [Phallusia mammillata]